MSGDKDNDGTVDQLTRWKQIMSRLRPRRRPVPARGRQPRPHRAARRPARHRGPDHPGRPGQPRPTTRNVFADRPYPFGDAAPYNGIGPLAPGRRPGRRLLALLRRRRQRALDLPRQLLLGASPTATRSRTRPSRTPRASAGQFEFLERKARRPATPAARLRGHAHPHPRPARPVLDRRRPASTT